MALFKRNEQHSETVAEKPDLERAAKEAGDALQAVAIALANHDTEASRLLRELEISTSALDAATLADDQRQIESLVGRRFDFQQRIESLARVRSHRAGLVESAKQSKRTAERAAAAEQQRGLIDRKTQLNRQIVKAVEELGSLIARAEGVQTEILLLADVWRLDRPAGRWLLPAGFVRSKPGEALRSALDLRLAYGADMNLSRIVSDDTPAIEEELLLAELAAQAEEVALV